MVFECREWFFFFLLMYVDIVEFGIVFFFFIVMRLVSFELRIIFVLIFWFYYVYKWVFKKGVIEKNRRVVLRLCFKGGR